MKDIGFAEKPASVYTEGVETFAVSYVFYRLFYRMFAFLRDWYAGSFLVIAHRTLHILESFDRTFAWQATLRNFFQPLYQDHTIVGHFFGVIFRSFRLIAGTVLYAAIIAIAIVAYIVWAGIPPFVLHKGFFP